LGKNNIGSSMVKGTVYQRNKAIKTFQDMDKSQECKVILLSLKNAASGSNLVEGSHVILLDPMSGSRRQAEDIENQAIGRAYRQGQDKQITVVRIIIRDTIEHQLYLTNTVNPESSAAKSSTGITGIQNPELAKGEEDTYLMAMFGCKSHKYGRSLPPTTLQLHHVLAKTRDSKLEDVLDDDLDSISEKKNKKSSKKNSCSLDELEVPKYTKSRSSRLSITETNPEEKKTKTKTKPVTPTPKKRKLDLCDSDSDSERYFRKFFNSDSESESLSFSDSDPPQTILITRKHQPPVLNKGKQIYSDASSESDRDEPAPEKTLANAPLIIKTFGSPAKAKNLSMIDRTLTPVWKTKKIEEGKPKKKRKSIFNFKEEASQSNDSGSEEPPAKKEKN